MEMQIVTAFNDDRTFRLPKAVWEAIIGRVTYYGEYRNCSFYRWTHGARPKAGFIGNVWLLAEHVNTWVKELGLTFYVSGELLKAIAWEQGWGPRKNRTNENPNTDNTPNLSRRATRAAPAGAR